MEDSVTHESQNNKEKASRIEENLKWRKVYREGEGSKQNVDNFAQSQLYSPVLTRFSFTAQIPRVLLLIFLFYVIVSTWEREIHLNNNEQTWIEDCWAPALLGNLLTISWGVPYKLFHISPVLFIMQLFFKNTQFYKLARFPPLSIYFETAAVVLRVCLQLHNGQGLSSIWDRKHLVLQE